MCFNLPLLYDLQTNIYLYALKVALVDCIKIIKINNIINKC